MAENVSEDELQPIKEYMSKNAVSDREKNEAWSGSIAATALNGVDVFNGRDEAIGAITTKDVQNFMRALLDQNNYRVIVLDPEIKE